MYKPLDVRSLFLEEFIKRIIIRSMPKRPKLEKKEVLLEKLDEVVKAPPRLDIEPKKIEPIKRIKQKPQIMTKQPRLPAKQSQIPSQIISKQPRLPAKPQPPQALVKPRGSKTTIMDKLNMIFSDPGVQALNCLGPNKNVLITVRGLVQTTHISFNENEIKDFINELSEKTRIPLIPGLIKVIYQNLLITAVVSEFVGTKFVVERRKQLPMQPPAKIQFR